MKTLSTIFLSLSLVCAASVSVAETDPDKAIEYRKNIMSMVGGSSGSMAAILKGDVEVENKEEMLKILAAGLVSATSADLNLAAFKQNTDGKGSEKTTATSKVWENWEEFVTIMKRMSDASVEVQKLAEAGELTEFKQLRPVVAECRECHGKGGFRSRR